MENTLSVARLLGNVVWSADLAASELPDPYWLWNGYVATGNITLLTSQWKSGKTTLVSVLLARMGAGGTLAGQDVRAGRALVVTEEDQWLWRGRCRQLGFGNHVGFLCRPFVGLPSEEDWAALLGELERLCRDEKIELVVIDPLAAFFPGGRENESAAVLAALMPLRRLTGLGAAVLLVHHPAKGRRLIGQVSRGSGALPATVDVLIEMAVGSVDPATRLRRLLAWSRHGATPRQLLIELDRAGADYVVASDSEFAELAANWHVLRGVLEDATYKLTRREIVKLWPQDYPRPNDETLWRWLDRAVASGLVERCGAGRRNLPFRFWLAGRSELPTDNPSDIEL